MQEDDPAPLPGCFGCLGDTGMLVIALLILGVALLHSFDGAQALPLVQAAVPVHGDDAEPPPLQFCAPVAPTVQGPAIDRSEPPTNDEVV